MWPSLGKSHLVRADIVCYYPEQLWPQSVISNLSLSGTDNTGAAGYSTPAPCVFLHCLNALHFPLWSPFCTHYFSLLYGDVKF